MKQLKRTIGGWKDDVQNSWGKLKTFHRIALGITLAMIMVYMARNYLLDPMQKKLSDKHQEMDKKGIPLVVPSVDKDEEVQKLQMKLESLNRSLPNWQRQRNDSISRRPQINVANLNTVLTEFDRLFGNAGLILQNRSEPGADLKSDLTTKKDNKDIVKNKRNLPLKVLIYHYELAGTFQSIYNFLQHLDVFLYPAKICDTEITLATDKHAGFVTYSDEPLILLDFHLELYYHDK